MTEIVSGTMQDFKRMVETSLGRSLETGDVAVLRDKSQFFNSVDAIDVKDFLAKMLKEVDSKNITSKDVIVITAEDLAAMDKEATVDHTKGTKLKR